MAELTKQVDDAKNRHVSAGARLKVGDHPMNVERSHIGRAVGSRERNFGIFKTDMQMVVKPSSRTFDRFRTHADCRWILRYFRRRAGSTLGGAMTNIVDQRVALPQH